jgi:hypothetical protein
VFKLIVIEIKLHFNHHIYKYIFQLSSRKVVEAFISRIKEVQPIINAVTDADFERTLLESDEADRTVEQMASDSEAIARLAIDYPLLGMQI